MPRPINIDPYLGAYLDELEARVASIENPQEPAKLFTVSSSNLTTGNAASYAFRAVLVTDLNIIAHSNGAHWFREDTGAQIV